MKKIVFIVLVITLFSCEDFLVENPKSIAVETFYNTKAEIDAAVAAAYSPLRGLTAYVYYVNFMETFSDYQQGRGSWGPNSNFDGLNGTNVSRTEGIWDAVYLSIRNANLVIMNAPDGRELSDAEKSRAIAEAKFVRAFNYFLLVKNYKGVPIRTEDNFNELAVARDTEEEVYQLIISDLTDAETNLPDNAPLPGRASKWAAKTLLADVYFYRGMNSEAASKSNEVIASNKYSLVPVQVVDDFYKIFGPNVVTSSEEIFYLKNSHEDGTTYPLMHNHPGTGFVGPGGWYALHSDREDYVVMKNWDPGDLRSQLWYNWDIGLGPNTMLSKKFIDPEAPAWNMIATDFPVYRYADVLLLNAEADCRASGSVTADAVERLNMVRRRAYGHDPLTPSPVDFSVADFNIDSFNETVLLERCYETNNEGKRWDDLKRLGAAKLKEIIKEHTGKNVADKHLLWPLPQDEFTYNEALDPATDQNPGY
jgi:hypothetical protein